MVMKQYGVVWTKRSQTQMKIAFEFISKDYPKNAVKVLEDIVAALYKAVSNPEYYSKDKYKKDNDGSYRAFEKHRYRIVYRFNNSVLRVKHTSREPKEY